MQYWILIKASWPEAAWQPKSSSILSDMQLSGSNSEVWAATFTKRATFWKILNTRRLEMTMYYPKNQIVNFYYENKKLATNM